VLLTTVNRKALMPGESEKAWAEVGICRIDGKSAVWRQILPPDKVVSPAERRGCISQAGENRLLEEGLGGTQFNCYKGAIKGYRRFV
jgi:hypothetical protein